MVYKKFRKRRRRTIDKSGLSKREAKRVRELIAENIEVKYKDTAINDSTAYTGNSQFHLLTGIGTGDSESQRTGMEIKLRSIQINLRISDIGSGNAVGDGLCRVMLILVKDTNGADPPITDILTTDNVMALRYWDERKDYTVLWDKKIVLRKHDTVSHVSKVWLKHYRKFPRGIRTMYDDVDVVVGSTEKNHLYLVLMSDLNDTNDPNFLGNVRVTYTDA